jgi:hypothetical protein
MKELTPSQKGAAAEAAITAEAIQLGLTVLRPLCEGRRYDLVIDLEPNLLRVQCKLARRLSGVLSVHLQTSRYTPGGYVKTNDLHSRRDRCYRRLLARLAPLLLNTDQRGVESSGAPSQAGPDQEQPGPEDQMGSRLRVRVRHRPTSIGARDTPHRRRTAKLADLTRGYSSAGRALRWHRRGRRFEPD